MSNELGDQVLRTNLGSYAQYAYVASGGFGTVFFGRDLQNNRAVAIKRLHGHLAYQPTVVERFEQEAQRLRGLQHPNIVQVLDEGKDSAGLPFIILQWVEGWTVAALLEQRGRFAIAEAVEIASQVLAALEAAGQRGVVHRDIKPANLMVTPPPDRRVKVMDFGIAKDVLADASGQYTQIGTLAYMAPEQFSQGRVDARTDLYALGVTLYELLTGQRPTGGLSNESPTTLRELRPEVDPALAAIVSRALEKRPADRFQTPEQMRAALAPFAGRAVDLTVPAGTTIEPEAAPADTRLSQLYAAASQALETHAWSTAVELFEAVVGLDPGYRQAAALLAEARRQHTLADLYGQARELHHAQQWPAVLDVLERIRMLDVAYDDPVGLGPAAREALAAEQRQQEDLALFKRGIAHLDASEWPQAIGILEQLQHRQPDFPNIGVWLARARDGLTRQAERDRQERAQREEDVRRQRLAALYAAAERACQAGAWAEAIGHLQGLLTLEPTQPQARALLEHATRHQQLGELYAQAHHRYAARDWVAVIGLIDRIQAVDPAYPDPDRLRLAANEQLAAAARAVGPTFDASATVHPRPAHTLAPPPAPAPAPVEASRHPAREATIIDAARPPVTVDDDGRLAGRPGWRRIGTPIWAGGAVALLALGIVAQQVASGQTGRVSVPTPTPVVQRGVVGPGPAVTAQPTAAPPTPSPLAAIPATAVPPTPTSAATATPAPSATPAATSTAVPTAQPTVDDLWRTALVQIDQTWSRDWPETIRVLSAFVAAHPGFSAGQDKLYAARLFYADQLLAAGNVDGAVEQLDAANTLLPQRPEANQTLVALTPPPTPTTPPYVVVPVPQSKPVVPAKPRSDPPPVAPLRP